MTPLPHNNFYLDEIKIQPPHGTDPRDLDGFDEVTNKLKWAEVQRCLQMYANNPTRIPKNPLTLHLPEPQQTLAFTPEHAAAAKVAFEKTLKVKKAVKNDKKAQKYHKQSFVPEIQAKHQAQKTKLGDKGNADDKTPNQYKRKEAPVGDAADQKSNYKKQKTTDAQKD